jgi:PKD repeat protein
MDRFGNYVWTFPDSPKNGILDTGGFEFPGAPAVADLDSNVSGLEVVEVHRPTGTVFAFDGDNSDGIDDGITFTGLPLYTWSGTEGIDWDVLWIYDMTTTDNFTDDNFNSPAIGDVDNDGELEVVTGSCVNSEFIGCSSDDYGPTDGDVFVLDGATGTLEHIFDTGGIQASAAIANLDSDQYLEIVIGSLDNHVYAFEWDGKSGKTEWTYNTSGSVYSSAAIGNLDGDQELEIVVGSDSHDILALKSTGALEWSYSTGKEVRSSPALADRLSVDPYDIDWQMFRHDSMRTGYYGASSHPLDVYVGSHDHYLYLIDGNTGTMVDRFLTNGRIPTSPSIGDIDGDGMLNIVFYAWGEGLGFPFTEKTDDVFWEIEDTEEIGGNPPEADFDWDPEIPDEGSLVSFFDLSTDPDDDIVSWSWTFGDGDTSTLQDPTHAYGHGGSYNVTLTVTDATDLTDTAEKTIQINNVPPTVEMSASPNPVDEGSPVTFDGSFYDPSWLDTHTAVWNFGDWSSETGFFSPGYGFTDHEMDSTTHTYCDNGIYHATLKVTDNFGDSGSDYEDIEVLNVAPNVDASGDKSGTETVILEFGGSFTDPGCDSWTWWWDFRPTLDSDGDGDPTNDADASGTTGNTGMLPVVNYEFNDDFDGDVYLWVEDDDNGLGVDTVHVTVDNAAPIVTISAYTFMDVTLRVAGEKWHDVSMYIYDEDGNLLGSAGVVRYPGSPDEQSVTISNVKLDLSKGYSITVVYTPPDDPVNGQPNGANPAWLLLNYEDECCEEIRLHHTFNVKHEDTWIWNVDMAPYMGVAGQTIHFEGHSSDAGSDDATFNWNFGDWTSEGPNEYFNDGWNHDPYPSYWFGLAPFTAMNHVTHVYASTGVYTVTLTVEDDDGTSTVETLNLDIKEGVC